VEGHYQNLVFVVVLELFWQKIGLIACYHW